MSKVIEVQHLRTTFGIVGIGLVAVSLIFGLAMRRVADLARTAVDN